MRWDGNWKCTKCDKEIYTSYDDKDGIMINKTSV